MQEEGLLETMLVHREKDLVEELVWLEKRNVLKEDLLEICVSVWRKVFSGIFGLIFEELVEDLP